VRLREGIHRSYDERRLLGLVLPPWQRPKICTIDQKRITALRDFLAGELVVFGDVRFTEMDRPAQMRFYRTPFPCFELDYCNDEDVLMELYDRLNFGGTPQACFINPSVIGRSA